MMQDSIENYIKESPNQKQAKMMKARLKKRARHVSIYNVDPK